MVAACSGHAERQTTAESKQGLTSVVPLNFTQYQDASYRTFVAAAVDDAGNTFVLAYAGSATGGPYFVYQFDPNGAFVQRITSAQGTGNTQQHLRVNDSGLALGGYLVTGIGTNHNVEQMTVDRFNLDGTRTFHCLGAAPSVTRSVDICGDGSVVAAANSSSTGIIMGLDATGNVTFTTQWPNVTPAKIRCLGDGTIIVAGKTVTSPSGPPYAASLAPDGTVDWTWTATDTRAQDNVSVLTGARGPSGSQHYYSAQLDLGGDLLWTRDDPFEGGMNAHATGVSMDGADNTFVCGDVGSDVGATLHGLDGATSWLYDMESVQASYADVTNGVARCVGQTAAHGIGILAFQVQ